METMETKKKNFGDIPNSNKNATLHLITALCMKTVWRMNDYCVVNEYCVAHEYCLAHKCDVAHECPMHECYSL